MLNALLEVARDLTANVAAEARYQHVVDAIRRVLPSDGVALLALHDDTLVPLSAQGLRQEVMGRRFALHEHPRLAQIMGAETPVRFPANSELPDPYDGLLAQHQHPWQRVHACMGCALRVDNRPVGALTLDSSDPHAFDNLDDDTVAMVAALAAAAMKTAQVVDALEEASRRQGLVAAELVAETQQRRGGGMLGSSAAMAKVRADVQLLAGSELPALITGETGVGKELVARAIHSGGSRARLPLIYVNCAALPETIAESELFGHMRGAFTGAHDTRAGKFEAADTGTLFLDEVGELPLGIQPKLLRALQSGEVQRVGSDRFIRVDVRILAATNRILDEEVAAGRFRADLYHRLSVFPLDVPPLRQRPEDVAVLAAFFLDNARNRLGLGPIRLTSAAEAALSVYDWPGNVRELEHMMLRAALKASGGRRREKVLVDTDHLDCVPASAAGVPAPAAATAPALGAPPSDAPLREATDAFQRHMVSHALNAAQGNWSKAATRLGMDRANLHRVARRLGITASV